MLKKVCEDMRFRFALLALRLTSAGLFRSLCQGVFL